MNEAADARQLMQGKAILKYYGQPESCHFFSSDVALGMAVPICLSAVPPLLSRVKDLNNRRMHCHESLHRHLWFPEDKPCCLLLVPWCFVQGHQHFCFLVTCLDNYWMDCYLCPGDESRWCFDDFSSTTIIRSKFHFVQHSHTYKTNEIPIRLSCTLCLMLIILICC